MLYDAIYDFVGHAWQSSGYSSDQGYIYQCCLVLVVFLTLWVLDIIKAIFLRRKK